MDGRTERAREMRAPALPRRISVVSASVSAVSSRSDVDARAAASAPRDGALDAAARRRATRATAGDARHAIGVVVDARGGGVAAARVGRTDALAIPDGTRTRAEASATAVDMSTCDGSARLRVRVACRRFEASSARADETLKALTASKNLQFCCILYA